MLTFASAGLDSMIKQLVRDALAKVIDRSEAAQGNFKLFIEKRLAKQGTLDPRFLSDVLASRDPRDVLVTELVRELTSQSLQSKSKCSGLAHTSILHRTYLHPTAPSWPDL